MAEWRIVYAGMRETFPKLDRTLLRDAAKRFSNENDAFNFIVDQLGSQMPQLSMRTPQEGTGEVITAASPEEPSEHFPSQAVTPEEPQSALESPEERLEEGKPSAEANALENWAPYLQAAVTAADCSTDLGVQAATATLPPSDTLVSEDKPSEVAASEEQESQAVSPLEEVQTEASLPTDEEPTLEDLVRLSVEEKEKLAGDLAAYAKLRELAVAKEAEVEAAKERTRVAGEAEKKKRAEVQQAVEELERVNERRSGEVNGELAMLATEAKELRRNLALLNEERAAIRAMLEPLQASLQSRIASAETVIAAEEAEAGQRTAYAQAAVDVVEAKRAEAEVEKGELDRKEAEAEKLHSFIMQQGKLVDSMLAEVAMLKEDLASVERLATSQRSLGGQPIQSSFLTVGQLGSALRRSSHSQGDAPASSSVHASTLGLEGTGEGSSASRASDQEGSQAGVDAQVDLAASGALGSVHSSHPSLPSLLSEESVHSLFQSANASMRMSQAPQGEATAYPAGENPLEEAPPLQPLDFGSDMGRYGPSPSNLTSQYLGVFQQHLVPSYVHDEQPEEDWALLESDSSMSGSHD